MPVMYSNNKLIPVPTVVIDKDYLRTGAGKLRRPFWRVIVNGYLSLHKGSPDYNGDFWQTTGYPPDTPSISIAEDSRLEILQKKKAALANLFSEQGKLFEVQPYNGSASIKFIPRVVKTEFQSGPWVNFVQYTISMETDFITFGSVSQPANEDGDDDVQETWQIEATDDKNRTYRMSHTVSAQASDLYDESGTGTLVSAGWELAKERASAFLGFDSTVATNYIYLDLSGYQDLNHAIQETIDEGEGRYSATETWLLYPGTYIEDYTVTSRRSLTDGQINVTVEGTVTGFATGDGFSDRFTNAQTGWTAVQAALYSRATTVSGVTLNGTVFNYTVGQTPTNGIITYSYEYNNRFTGQIPGALSESISLVDSLPTDIFAIHRVVARPAGPIIQDIVTNSESRRTITISANMPPASQAGLAAVPSDSVITALLVTYTPTASEAGPYVERNETSFDYYTGKYNRVVSWVYV